MTTSPSCIVTIAHLIERLSLYPPGWQVHCIGVGYEADGGELMVGNWQEAKQAGNPNHLEASIMSSGYAPQSAWGHSALTSLIK